MAILRLATRFIPIQWLGPIPILRLGMSLIPTLRLGLSLIPILRLGWLVPILRLVLLAAMIAVLTHAQVLGVAGLGAVGTLDGCRTGHACGPRVSGALTTSLGGG
jgi:hypothetical protein